MARLVKPILVGVLGFLSQLASAEARSTTAADLIQLDFEELVNMSVEVESAGKNKARVMDLPYAAFVVTAKDIRASGAQSIPDALRLAPGVAVGQISAGEWAVSIRGLGGRFSRFVLVMVDGRVAYNSAFSGVNWEELNITLSEIDRIEVIRGPNAAAWGANAVNGIINIITRPTEAGTGNRVNVWAGPKGRAGQSFAANYSSPSDWHWGVAGHVNQWAGLMTEAGGFQEEPHRDWRIAGGVTHKKSRSSLQFKFDLFGSEQSPEWSWREELINKTVQIDENKFGWVGQLKHEFQISEKSIWKSRLSFDNTARENRLFNWDSRNYQIDTEISMALEKHQLSAGVNSRYSDSNIVSADFFTMRLDPSQRSVAHYGVYLSDVYQPLESLQISLAARLDHSELSEPSVQPSARLLWAPDDSYRVWLAYSKASSTPSRAIVDVSNVPYGVVPANGAEQPYPLLLIVDGHTGDEKDVKLQATELGFRKTFDSYGIDLTLFDFNYSDEVYIEPAGDPEIVFADIFTPLYIRQRVLFNNSRSLKSHGAELSIRAQPLNFWSSQFVLSAMKIDKDGANDSRNFGFLNSFTLSEKFQLNVNIRYANGMDNTSSRFSSEVDTNVVDDTYYLADVNLDWSITNAFSLTFIANNLGKNHNEAIREEFSTRLLEVEPYALVRFTYMK